MKTCVETVDEFVAWSNQAILNEHGHLVEILSVDITQRKQAENTAQ